MENKTIINEIIDFWFEKTEVKQRFMKDPEFDALITERFFGVYEDIVAGELDGWKETSNGILAMIIVLDQFSRNMFRGNKKSFEYDHLVLSLAEHMVEHNLDKEILHERRSFVYMPYMHSESKEIHKKALEIFTEYGNEKNLEYEIKHKEIIDRFGRYPHRNEVLGRQSTSEEIEFLKDNPGF